MKTIQVVLDAELLRATDIAAKRARVNRSALVRQALREHLKRVRSREAEVRDQRGYLEDPQAAREARSWKGEARWPERSLGTEIAALFTKVGLDEEVLELRGHEIKPRAFD